MRAMIGTFGIVLLIWAGIACDPENIEREQGADSSRNSSASTWSWGKAPSIERGEFGTQYVVGTLKYNSSRQLSYVQVSCQIMLNQVQIADVFDNASGLQPNSSWRFKAILLENVRSYDDIRCQASGF